VPEPYESFCSAEPMFSSHSKLRLFQRRMVWYPTWLGFLCIACLLASPLLWWWTYGESFLSQTGRSPAEVLVVEGWIGQEGVRAARAEFEQHGYLYVVTTGGLTTGEGWEEGGWSYAEGAEHELIRDGVAKDRIIVASAKDAERQRTYQCAVAVWRTLQAKGIQPKAINVFTFGPHARRSRLVFAKVCGPKTEVGVISWVPTGHPALPWWRSSQRARDMITETAGYLFELLLNSGRPSSSPGTAASPSK
jgi:hypothetical protein